MVYVFVCQLSVDFGFVHLKASAIVWEGFVDHFDEVLEGKA